MELHLRFLGFHSLAIWDHTVLCATRQKWTHPALSPARQLSLILPTREGWKAELVYLPADARRILTAIPQSELKKPSRTSSHLLVGHYEERSIISQPQCGRCHQAGTGQATLKVIGNKQSCALNWCELNNDDDDDDDDDECRQLPIQDMLWRCDWVFRMAPDW